MQPASAYRIAWHPGPPVAGLDTGMLGTELAGDLEPRPDAPRSSELQAALGAYTGLDAASPRTAEIVGAVVAAITATVLAERPPSGGTAPLLHDGPRRAPSGVRNGRPDVARLTLAGASALPWTARCAPSSPSTRASPGRTATTTSAGTYTSGSTNTCRRLSTAPASRGPNASARTAVTAR